MRLNSLRTALIVTLTAWAVPASAHPYEATIDVETEEDLADLLATSQITEDTYDTLITLLAAGVDLNTATRDQLYALPNLTYPDVDAILAFRKERGRIEDPAELVAAGALTQDKLLAIAAFIELSGSEHSPLGAKGWLRVRTRATTTDDNLPPMSLRARAVLARYWTIGVGLVATRERLGDITYDPNRDALLAKAPGVQLHVPKAFVKYETETAVATLGSYRVGFGQRLVFDNTTDYTPNGVYLDDLIYSADGLTKACKQNGQGETTQFCEGDPLDTYVTPDFRWREGLFGVAGGAKQVAIGNGWLQAIGWGSYQQKSIYQYELVDNGKCDDARQDDDPACGSPTVLEYPEGDILTPVPAYGFQTLPNVMAEALAGANLSYYADRRNWVGVTGYGASLSSLIEGIELDTQEWSRLPNGGSYGAVGVNAAFGHNWLDVFAEAAYSFDKLGNGAGLVDGGGGPAAIVRATATQKKQELEVSLRYFDPDYVNPYARPIAASDELEGQRVRDELGGRVRYHGEHGPLTVRSALDLWAIHDVSNPLDESPPRIVKGAIYAHADVQASDTIRWGAWVDYEDKNLGEGTTGDCYETPIFDNEYGEPIPCAGRKLRTAGRLRFDPNRTLSLTGQVQHALVSDDHHASGNRHDLTVSVAGMLKPSADLRIRGRIRYLSQDVQDRAYLEESLWAYGEVGLRVRKRDQLRVRADVYQWLDTRSSTDRRSPNPELWLWLQYEARFP